MELCGIFASQLEGFSIDNSEGFLTGLDEVITVYRRTTRTLRLRTSYDVALTPWLVTVVTQICFIAYSVRHVTDFWIVFGAVLELILALAPPVVLFIFRKGGSKL
jgi:hypothetical protein